MKSSSPTMRLLSFVALLLLLAGQWLIATPPVRAANDPEIELLCAADFTSNKQGWGLGLEEDELRVSESMIAGGAYRQLVNFKQAAYSWTTAPDCQVSDFFLQVDATVLPLSDFEAGIVLLLRENKRNAQERHYQVIFYQDNAYEVNLVDGDEVTSLQARRSTRALAFDVGIPQRLAVLLIGDELTVYANDQALATVYDDTLAAGQIGLGVLGTAGQQINVAFDNFMVTGYKASDLIFADSFVDNQNAWALGRFTSAEVNCEDQIVRGRLQQEIVIKSDVNSCYSTAPTLKAQDFWLQVDAIWLQRHVEDSWLEIIFRQDETTGNQYNLRLTQDGYYTLEQYYQDEWHTLQAWTQSVAINRDRRETNTIQLWVRGPYMTLVVNDIELITVEDEQWQQEGLILLGLGGDSGVRTSVAFDNLIVRATPPTRN